MNQLRRQHERGTIVVLFVVALAGLVVVITAENVAGTIIRGHGRAHWHAENAARVAVQAIDEGLYHTTGARVVDLIAARTAARQYAAQLADPIDVVEVVRQRDPVTQKDSVTVTVVLQQKIDAGPASFTLPIVETASAQLQQS